MGSKGKNILDGEEDYYLSDDYLGEDDCAFADQIDETKPGSYTVLKEEDIRRRQDEDIAEVSAVLEISNESACLILRHFNWKVVQAKEEWFSDEKRVREAVGLLQKSQEVISSSSHSSGKPATTVICGICFVRKNFSKSTSLGCGHFFCNKCWSSYVTMAINDGPGCLVLKCPDPPCSASVGKDMIDKLGLGHKHRAKYNRYLIRSYVESCPAIKWCPAAGCDYAVELHDGDIGGSGLGCDVVCGCSNGFCWDCLEDAHRPVDCKTVSNWILKNSSEAENTTWILAYTKPCPKCKRAIEKNLGCMHMSCTAPCRFQFCWLCLQEWPHRGGTCNGYRETSAASGSEGPGEKKRKMAKEYLEKYTHYYERWASNHSSRNKAIADLNAMKNEHLDKLSDKLCQTESQLKFIIEAWQQIVECRRVLKWTYAYGFYLPAHESTKKQLFEYLQGQAEAGLDRLHGCAETELMKYLKNPNNEPLVDFNDFRPKLLNLTKVTGDYFDNLVRALENGLSDIDSQETISRVKKVKVYDVFQDFGSQAASTSNSTVWHDWTCDQCTYLNGQSATTCTICGLGVSPFGNTDEDPYYVACPYCTYLNVQSATTCAMCQQAR